MLAQLWMTTNDSKLENGYFWEWQDKTWSLIPSENMESFIEDSSGQGDLSRGIDNCSGAARAL